MTFSILHLDPDDDLVSIKDRLNWANSPQLILVLPEQGNLLVEELDLVLLRRYADQQRIQIGLVTHDSRVSQRARAVGFPVFPTIRLAKIGQRWWHQRRKQVSRPFVVPEEDQQEVYRRMTSKPNWQHWLWRYAGTLFFFISLSILFVATAYTLPTATLTLKPHTQPIQTSRQIVADPQLETVNFSGASVPARRLIATTQWESAVETTGLVELPDAPARGEVVFVNRQGEEIAIPAGTRVATSGGQTILFQTVAAIRLPATVGATASVNVLAVISGPQGNVPANAINRIEGPLGILVEVRNLEEMTGGAIRLSPAVSQADRERLRAQLIQQLQTLALTEMESSLLPGEFLAKDSLQIIEIEHETYSHFLNEQTDRLSLEIRATLQATAVNGTEAIGLVYEALIGEVPAGYTPVPDSLQFSTGDVLGVDNQGRVSFLMNGTGVVAAQLELESPLTTISGQYSDIALAYLYQKLPLNTYPTIQIFPNWFERIPYLPARIQVQIEFEP